MKRLARVRTCVEICYLRRDAIQYISAFRHRAQADGSSRIKNDALRAVDHDTGMGTSTTSVVYHGKERQFGRAIMAVGGALNSVDRCIGETVTGLGAIDQDQEASSGQQYSEVSHGVGLAEKQLTVKTMPV